mgnify:FL=1|tara:strand:- start:233 stop:436 length:204 start_codon:yes stop_codon:yes gene_type:complete
MTLIPVENTHALYRDEESNAIVSTDMIEHQKYLESRKRKDSEKAELDSLKGELKEIKDMLKALVNGN